MFIKAIFLSFIFFSSQPSLAAEEHAHLMGPSGCNHMYYWDYSKGMCSPLTMAGMPMKMFMLHYNAFLTQTFEEGPRGRNAFSAPNMFMFDAGTSVGDRHYLNLEFMGTFEKWTYSDRGYPELLQIGEENEDHVPYIDNQHPHSSPIMGLTLSDTIRISDDKEYIKLSFAPRGQAAEGPVAFMHRPTGMINPDAPLGHHLGQDVGHISSTVFNIALRLSQTTYEFSAYNGTEPEPDEVDLPIDKVNSYAGRLTQEFTPHFYAMGSVAYIKDPEVHSVEPSHMERYSGSLYGDTTLKSGWMLHNTFIYGLIKNLDDTSHLTSFTHEFFFHREKQNIWGRFEALERTAGQLAILSLSPNTPKWVGALTLGYTQKVGTWDFNRVSLGASVTKDLLPEVFQSAYGGEPWTGKIFIQIGGMKMWEL